MTKNMFICFRSSQLEKGAVPTLKRGLDKECPMPGPSKLTAGTRGAVIKLERVRVILSLLHYKP